MHGIPVLIKDNIDTHDRMMTTAGSLALLGSIAPRDAFLVEQLRAAGIQIDYNVVTMTRRVFRDGGSEYFINKTSCRLKDIQQLFMGTGMGRSSYSIMAQGNITQIISSKPEDRRMVFEEAAGITKFKAQKKESLRKLEHYPDASGPGRVAAATTFRFSRFFRREQSHRHHHDAKRR